MFLEVDENIGKQENESTASNTKSIDERSIINELYYVGKRTLINVVRNPALFVSQITVSLIFGLLTGLVFYQMNEDIDPGIPNRLGAIFFIVTSQIFSTITALESLLKERVLFLHVKMSNIDFNEILFDFFFLLVQENVSGYYRTSTFFLTKLICDILPMRVLPSIIYSVLAYFLTGLRLDLSKFFIFFLTIFMCNIFGSATCFLISATIPVFGKFKTWNLYLIKRNDIFFLLLFLAVALIVVVLIFVVMMIFSGFIVELSSIFNWLSWIQWISAFRYASNMLTINELHNMTFCLTNQTNNCQFNGNTILKEKDIEYETDWDMWKNFCALTIIALIFFILSFIQLLRMKKTK